MKIKVEMFERQEGGRDFVTETDLLLFTEVSMDYKPAHCLSTPITHFIFRKPAIVYMRATALNLK